MSNLIFIWQTMPKETKRKIYVLLGCIFLGLIVLFLTTLSFQEARPKPEFSIERYTKVTIDANQCFLIAELDFNTLCSGFLELDSEYCEAAWHLTTVNYESKTKTCVVDIPIPFGHTEGVNSGS